VGINTLTANGGRFVVCLGRVFRKYQVQIVGRVWFRFVLDVDGASGTMVLIGVMFGKVVGSVGDTAVPVDNELALADAVADPIKTHVHGFGSFLTESLAMPEAVLLSVTIGVADWGCPSSSRVMRSGTASLPLW
jgi:hypothetical protein